MTRLADAFLTTDLLQAWTLLPGLDESAALLEALGARGWAVSRSFTALGDVVDALKSTPTPPDLLITRVRLPDGDAFELIRRLAPMRNAPALFFVSRQQRAVVKAAHALCEAHAVRVAGHADMPLRLDAALPQFDAFRTVGRVRRQHAQRTAPLPVADLQALVDNGGIRAFMQPKMRLSSGRVTGFEALMRGIGPDGQVITPLQLIEPLGNAGLLLPATLQMFDQTIAFLMDCLNDGIAVGASVNVPLSLISDHHFCRKLVEGVEKAGLDPSWITVEITEDEAMSNPALVIENTARIRMFGFNLSIDDFGTAYSSFAQLTKIPFSELKIERTFISGIESDKSKQAVVAACALLGSRLGLEVVAEGVETVAELTAVREAGCSDIQGYLISRPIPVPAAAAWLRALDGERFAPVDDAALQSWVSSL
jgi:EAL domain-containing protein (putative c-di-GMP-specific phosphodiesterase class I)